MPQTSSADDNGVAQGNAFTSRFPKWKESIDPRFLGAVSTPGVLNLSRPQCTTSWSEDNLVALITDGGGITVADFVHTHEELESGVVGFIGNLTKLSCVKPKDKDMENYVGISLTEVTKSRNKHEIFDLVRDSIICPKELINAETHLYYTKVCWSSHPMKMANGRELQHVLAASDSHFNIRLFIKHRLLMGDDNLAGAKIEEDDWEIFIDITESYRNVLLAQFWSDNNEATFDEFKRRMYELATVDFIWLPQWEDTVGTDVRASIVTAHASGDICIWHVCAINVVGDNLGNEESCPLKYFLSLEVRKKLISGEIICHLDFHKLSPTLGLLVVGTTKGSLKLFRVKYNNALVNDIKPVLTPTPNDKAAEKYSLEEGTVICENDMIEVMTTFGVTSEVKNEHRMILYVLKHPNFLLSFDVKVSAQKKEVYYKKIGNPVRFVNGTVTGAALMKYTNPKKTVMLAVTKRGVLSWINIEDGKVKKVSSCDLASAEETSSNTVGNKEQTKGRLQFGSLTVSPSKAMVCVSKTLDEHYSTLSLRSPSVLQFHSLCPAENVWSFVYEKCRANQFHLQKILDVLTAYRVIMSSSENYIKEVLDWAVPLRSKSLQDLQILFWILRIQPRVDKDQLALAFNLRHEEPQAFYDLKFKQVRAVRRETIVSDLIIQLRCLDLVKKVIENPAKYNLEGNVLNLQSLLTMYDYLETKTNLIKERGPLPRKPRVLVNPPPRKPACPLCGKPTKVMDRTSIEKRWIEGTDYIVEHEIDVEEIDGVLWHEQQHTFKSRTHPISSCVLSLVPISFEHRKCTFCGTIAMKDPSFEQKSVCPFCNGEMESPMNYYDEDELVGGADDLQRLLDEIEKDREEQKAAKAREAPISRRARIEKMYVE